MDTWTVDYLEQLRERDAPGLQKWVMLTQKADWAIVMVALMVCSMDDVQARPPYPYALVNTQNIWL